MKYICDFCGKEFDSYHGDSEFMTRQYDQVRIQFKPKFDSEKILIADYKCCPDCIGKVVGTIEELKILKTPPLFRHDSDKVIKYLGMRFGDQPIKPAFIRITNEILKGDSE